MTNLIVAKSGPLAGYIEVPVDIERLASYKEAAYKANVVYGWGAKDPNPGCGIIDYNDIDCSGFFRTLSDFITHLILRNAGLPDGSYAQADWFSSAFKVVGGGTGKFKYHVINSQQDYLDAAYINDNIYRVCFHKPGGRGGDGTGHVWVAVHNHTVESYGGHGPGERDVTHGWFEQHCDLVVPIGRMYSSADWNNKNNNPYI